MARDDARGDVELAGAISQLSGLLIAEQTPETTLERVTGLVVEMVDHADGAGISLVRGRVVESLAHTSDLQRQVDEIQTSSGQGPCLAAIGDAATAVFQIDDMTRDRRWPTFAQKTAQLGVLSKLAFVLRVDTAPSDVLGALNLYARNAYAFDAHDRAIGLIFANHAAVALANAQTHAADRLEVEQIHRALQTRDLIGQAKGMLMQRDGMSADEAFETLRTLSQRLNLKLRDIAQQVVDQHASTGS
jgi:hypothetical protein